MTRRDPFGGMNLEQLSLLGAAGLLSLRVDVSPRSVGMRQQQGRDGAQDLTWAEIAARSASIAKGLMAAGLKRGDRIGIWCSPSSECALVVLACQLIGCIPFGLHLTVSDEQLKAILADAGPVLVIVDSLDKLERVCAREGVLGEGAGACILGGEAADPSHRFAAFRGNLTALIEAGRSLPDAILSDETSRFQPDDIAAVFYTSGTTGASKGVMVTWRGLVLSLCGMFGRDALADYPRPEDRTLHEIGMATPTGFWFGLIYPLIYGCTAHIPGRDVDADDARRMARPTVYYGRPAVWLDTGRKIREGVARTSYIRRQAYKILMRAGKIALARQARGRGTRLLDVARGFLIRAVIGDMLAAAGLDAIRFAFCGGAPLPDEIVEQWFSWGVTIRTFYGMTECSGVATVVSSAIPRSGTVGKPGMFADVRLASDGEILIGGEILFKGYLGRPDLTRQAMSDDGFFMTGDLGEILDDGSLVMLDRKSNVVHLADGRAVVPLQLETALRSSPLVSFAIIVGTGRSDLCALVGLNERAVAEDAGVAENSAGPPKSATGAVSASIARHVADCSAIAMKAGLPPIRDFRIIDERLTPANSEVVTATGKIRRANLERRYAREIDAMYRAISEADLHSSSSVERV